MIAPGGPGAGATRAVVATGVADAAACPLAVGLAVAVELGNGSEVLQPTASAARQTAPVSRELSTPPAMMHFGPRQHVATRLRKQVAGLSRTDDVLRRGDDDGGKPHVRVKIVLLGLLFGNALGFQWIGGWIGTVAAARLIAFS